MPPLPVRLFFTKQPGSEQKVVFESRRPQLGPYFPIAGVALIQELPALTLMFTIFYIFRLEWRRVQENPKYLSYAV